MALTKQKKNEIVTELTGLLSGSKLTVVAKYEGTTVKSMQALRKEAKLSGTKINVVKNRLVKKALLATETLKDVDVSALKGQLMYAFNSEDEVAPAQVLNNFAKTNPNLQFIGAITTEGQFISAETVKELASLPGKEQLRGMLVGTLAAPLSGFVSVLSGNIRGLLNVLSAHAEVL